MAKILVIEDEMPVRANIAELLESEAFEVITAENGFIGVLWAQEHLPDLVICDVMMPELDGRDVLSALRNDPLTETVPFIFLTARADKSDIRLGMNLGADDYLTKPFSRRELLSAVQTRLSKYKSIEHRIQHQQEQVDALQQALQTLAHQRSHGEEYNKSKCTQAVRRLRLAINLLRKIPSSMHRRYCLQLLQELYDEELQCLGAKTSNSLHVNEESTALWAEFNQLNEELAHEYI